MIAQMEMPHDLITVPLVDPVAEDLHIPVLSLALVVHLMQQQVSHPHGLHLDLVVQEVQVTPAVEVAVQEAAEAEALVVQGELTSVASLLKVVLQVNLQISLLPVLEMAEM